MPTSRAVALQMVAGLLLFPLLSAVQGMPAFEVLQKLGAARRFTCAFPWSVAVEWERQDPQVQHARRGLVFQIDGIDYEQHRARFIGSAGTADLTALRGVDSVSFLDPVAVGRVMVTTVYAYGDAEGRFKAVHSSHAAFGDPAPSQHYGYCQAW